MSNQLTNKYVNSSKKRFFDLTFGLVFSPFILIVLLPIIFLKFLEDFRSPIFISSRVGLKEKNFKLLKIRSMSPGNHLKDHPTANKHSPITKFGKFLRRSKMDELPQIFNVLKGEMSIVGPRPNIPNQVYDGTYKENDFIIFSIKPGLVDLSSLYYSDLNNIASKSENPHQFYLINIFPKKKLLIKYYLANANILLDLIIILILPISILFPSTGRKLIKKFIKIEK